MEAQSAPPSSIAFPETIRSPLSPKSDRSKNANHPYAIKTTSTAVLSRSNSLSGPAVTPVFYQASPNAKPLGRSQSRGHRHSISLATFTSATPPTPLPLPPKRSESFSSSRNDAVLSLNESMIAELPDNPKSWSPRQLSIYLASALRFKGGGSLPVPVANDIAAFVLREKLSGRAFLRLSDENLKTMGVNHLWRESMLAAARTLRKKVLQGRIWGFGSQTEDEKDDNAEPVLKRRVPSTVVESDGEPASPSPSPPPTKGYRGGRVRGMIETLERSGSSDEADLANSDARLESQLRHAGLWIASEDSEVDDDADVNADVSASSSDSEAVAEYTHSRDSSGSQLSQRSQPPAYTQSLVQEPNDEPTVEELLSQESNTSPQGSLGNGNSSGFYEAPSLGAMAWENNTDIAGGTARKIHDIIPAPLHNSARRMLNGPKQPTVADMFSIPHQQIQKDQNQGSAQVPTEAYTLIQAFRTRLEAVEKKLMELEMRDEEREKEVQQLRENEKRRLVEEKQRRRDLFDKMDENYVGPAKQTDHTDDTDDVDIAWTKPAIRPAIVSTTKVVTALTIPGATSTQESKADDAPKVEEEEEAPRQMITRNRAHKTREVDVHSDPPLEDQPDPQASELPSYVFLVGLGVCAVVLRVLLRKVGGQRR